MDIALIVQPDEDTRFFMKTIGSTRNRYFMRSDHQLARRQSVSLKHLAKEVVILPEDGSLTQKSFERKLAAFGIPQLRVLKTATFPLVKEAVLTAVGSASCSRMVSTRL